MFATSKRYGVVAVCVIAVIVILFVVFGGEKSEPTPPPVSVVATTPAPTAVSPVHRVVGHSVSGRKIEQYTFGTGKTHLLFVGGMHGGYEWNSVVLAYEFIDYLNTPKNVPDRFTISVIPSANPDGVFAVVGKEGEFTANEVRDVSKKPI